MRHSWAEDTRGQRWGNAHLSLRPNIINSINCFVYLFIHSFLHNYCHAETSHCWCRGCYALNQYILFKSPSWTRRDPSTRRPPRRCILLHQMHQSYAPEKVCGGSSLPGDSVTCIVRGSGRGRRWGRRRRNKKQRRSPSTSLLSRPDNSGSVEGPYRVPWSLRWATR